MKKAVFIIAVFTVSIIVISSVFTGCSGQKFAQETDQQYAYSFDHPSGWNYTLFTAFQLSITPNGDVKQEEFINKDGTMLDFEVRIVNDYTQYNQAETYMSIPAEELRYTNYTEDNTTVDGLSAQEYVFTTFGLALPYDGIVFVPGSQGTMIWFSSTKYEYVFFYIAPPGQSFNAHHDVYTEALSSFVAS